MFGTGFLGCWLMLTGCAPKEEVADVAAASSAADVEVSKPPTSTQPSRYGDDGVIRSADLPVFGSPVPELHQIVVGAGDEQVVFVPVHESEIEAFFAKEFADYEVVKRRGGGLELIPPDAEDGAYVLATYDPARRGYRLLYVNRNPTSTPPIVPAGTKVEKGLNDASGDFPRESVAW